MGHRLESEVGDVWDRAEAADLRAIFFLRRLSRLLSLRRSVNSNAAPGLVRLLDRAIYSTYVDARTLGWEDDARRLLRDESSGR